MCIRDSIRSALQHYPVEPFITNKIQSAMMKLQLSCRPVTIAAVYSPPHLNIVSDDYEELLTSLEQQFLIAGDWNAKNTVWRSRLTTPKGRHLLKVIQHHNMNYIATGEPTYWPSDLNKIPDLLDFAITKGISDIYSEIKSNFDLSSDRSPVLITLSTNPILKAPLPKLCTKNRDWDKFQTIINSTICLLYTSRCV